MICLECSRLDLQANPKHAAVGLGKCKFDPVGQFRPFSRDRQCGNFVAAEAEVKQKRIDWWKGKGK